jgi:hypothetical protein
MMAPSLVGVEVPEGKHLVVFRYKPYAGYPILLAIGAIALLALTLIPRRAEVAQLIRSRLRRQPRVATAERPRT